MRLNPNCSVRTRWYVALLAAAAIGSSAIARLDAGAGDGGYKLVEGWPEAPPGQAFGNVTSAAVDANGLVYAFRRCPASCDHPAADAAPFNNFWTFNTAGKFQREWGKGIAKEAHGIYVDRAGFIWTTDVQGHQVKKSSADGKVLLTLGKLGVPGDGPETFNKPTGVWVTAGGDVFVTDGYGNQRVVKFDKDGKFVKAFGSKGAGPGQFRLPHAIVQDSRGRLYIADRCGSTSIGNQGCTDGRIEIFDTDGKFLEEWKQIDGKNFVAQSLGITRDDRLYVSANSTVWILDSRTGKVLEAVPNVRGGHGVAVDAGGDNIYVAAADGGIRRYSRSK